MEQNKYERRSFGGRAEPQIRNREESESRTIVGYAVVFGEQSEVLCDWDGRFIETIQPSAITPELLERSDITALLEHNHERLLARSYMGKGTLRLSIDAVGLRYEFEAPRTADGETALELVRRGDIAGSSFAFVARSEGAVTKEWDAERKLWKRSVCKIDSLHDVTLTCRPAYTQTSVDARSLEAPTPEPSPTPEPRHIVPIE